RRSSRIKPRPRLPDARATSQVATTAKTKTGTARICAGLTRTCRTMRAATTTMLPVTCAVKMPRLRNPITSTMPAMALSQTGSHRSELEISSLVANIINDELRHEESERHRQDNENGDRTVTQRRGHQLPRPL